MARYTRHMTEIDEETRKIIQRIEAAENFREQYKDIWERCYKRWRNYVEQLKDKDRANISIPYTFVQVETILPRLVESLFAARPYVVVKGREHQDVANAGKMETLLDWQMCERMDIQDLFHTGLKELCIYGTAVAYVGWRYSERTVTKRVQSVVYEPDPLNPDEPRVDPLTMELVPILGEDGNPLMTWQEEEVTEVVYDDPEVKFIDLGLFFVDPNATDIEDARYCGHTAFLTRQQLEDMAAMDDEIKLDWANIPKDPESNTVREERMAAVGLGSAQANEDTLQDDEMRLYKVDFYWEDDRQVILINRSYRAKDGKNPFWHQKKPYVKDVYTRVPHEFYGIGLVEMIEDLQDELNAERNMRLDYRALSMRRMFKVKYGSRAASQDLKWRQNGRIYVDNMDEIEALEPPDGALAGSFNQEQVIKADIRDTTGAHDIVMGASSSSTTATEVMTRDNNAAMRFRLIISSIEKRLLVGIARFMIQLNQQFMDSARVLRVTGENGDDWVQLTPEDIQGEFDLVAAGSSVEPMANKESYKQRMLEAFQIVSANPIMQQYPEKIINMLKKVLEAFDIKDTESILPSDDELSGMMQQRIIQGVLAGLPPELRALLDPQTAPSAPNMPNPGRPGIPNTAPMQEPAMGVMMR